MEAPQGKRVGFWLTVAAIGLMAAGIWSPRWMISSGSQPDLFGLREFQSCNGYDACEKFEASSEFYEEEFYGKLAAWSSKGSAVLIVAIAALALFAAAAITKPRRELIQIATLACAAAAAAAVYWVEASPHKLALGPGFPTFLVGALTGLFVLARRPLPPPMAAPPPPPPPPPAPPAP